MATNTSSFETRPSGRSSGWGFRFGRASLRPRVSWWGGALAPSRTM